MTKIINCYAGHNQAAKGRSRLNLKYLNLGLFALGLILVTVYLVNISQLTVQGFTLRELKSRAAALNNEILEKEEKVSAAQSYYIVNTRTKDLQMVAVDNIEYLSTSAVAVLRK